MWMGLETRCPKDWEISPIAGVLLDPSTRVACNVACFPGGLIELKKSVPRGLSTAKERANLGVGAGIIKGMQKNGVDAAKKRKVEKPKV
jgi:hypothetical protein